MANYFQFPSPIVFAVSGKDSERYLNARLTNNIRTLEINKSCLAAQLSPQGKTEGLFRVYRDQSDHFLLYADGGDSAQILTAFKRYIVADRVEVEDLSNAYRLVHLFAAVVDTKLSFAIQRTAVPGLDLLLKNEESEM
jgi:folate-binding Fe-S cluster repair protein YgfZ